QTVPAGAANVNFIATALPAQTLNFPDLSVVIPGNQISIAGTGTTRELQYTHDTFNGGTDPLIIQPTYNQATCTYQGTQHVYSLNKGLWRLSQRIPRAGVFVYHAEHGHFHFPFSAYGIYAVAPDGGVGAPVAMSGKVGFCIADSFIYDSLLPNAGALG